MVADHSGQNTTMETSGAPQKTRDFGRAPKTRNITCFQVVDGLPPTPATCLPEGETGSEEEVEKGEKASTGWGGVVITNWSLSCHPLKWMMG